MITPHPITTVEQLQQAGDIGRCELLRGELVMMSPGSWRHGQIALRIGRLLGAFVDAKSLGATSGAETGFVIERDPDTLRAPDVAFVRRSRMHLGGEEGFFPGPPDLAVEVLSPNDIAGQVLDKVQQWLDAGTQSVWVADPKRRTVSVYRKDQPVRVYREGESLTEESLLPGFTLSISDVFAE